MACPTEALLVSLPVTGSPRGVLTPDSTGYCACQPGALCKYNYARWALGVKCGGLQISVLFCKALEFSPLPFLLKFHRGPSYIGQTPRPSLRAEEGVVGVGPALPGGGLQGSTAQLQGSLGQFGGKTNQPLASSENSARIFALFLNPGQAI